MNNQSLHESKVANYISLIKKMPCWLECPNGPISKIAVLQCGFFKEQLY